MPALHRFLLSGLLLLATVGGLGCAGSQNREYTRELGPLVGRAPVAYFLERYGEPEQRTAIDSRTEVLRFRVAEETLTGRSAHATVSVATDLRLTFKDGVLAAWQVSNALR